MRYTVLTLFPALLEPLANEGLLKQAREKGLIEIVLKQLRDYAQDKHRTVDDRPYGGGAGMVLKVDILEKAIASNPAQEVLLLTPDGTPFTQALARELAERSSLTLVCGRYEGFDARAETLATRLVSIGDYVLMGGELAAGVIIEATARLLPGVLGDPQSAQGDSFTGSVLDYPEYTRPPVWRGLAVPEVLLSGHHAQVARWRRQEALRRTLERRPDLLQQAPLSQEDLEILKELRSPEPED